MNFKALALSSAAIVALSGMALAADPEERVVTQQLNSQQLDTPSIVTTGARPYRMAPTPANVQTMPLDEISNPASLLIHRTVENQAGRPIGTVQQVIVDDEGRAVSVDVNLDRQDRTVSIDADAFVYDQAGDVLITDMSMSEINDLPTF